MNHSQKKYPDGYLELWRPRTNMEPISFPQGITLREIRSGEEEIWCALFEGDMGITEVSKEFFEKKMRNDPTVQAGNIYMAVNEKDIPVGTVTVQVKDNNKPALHMVTIQSSYRGLGLGKALVNTVAQQHFLAGRDGCYIFTQFSRVPAICMYLSMDFHPLIIGPEMVAIYKKFGETLGRTSLFCWNEAQTELIDVFD